LRTAGRRAAKSIFRGAARCASTSRPTLSMRGAHLATRRGRNGPLTMRRSRRWLSPSAQTRRVVYWSAVSPSGRALVRTAASRRLNRSSFSTLWQSAYRATSHVPDVVRSSGAVSRSRRKKSQGTERVS